MVDLAGADEIYGAHQQFGEALMTVPLSDHVRLKVKVTCSTESCHVLILTKEAFESLRDAYGKLVDCMESMLADKAKSDKWVRITRNKQHD